VATSLLKSPVGAGKFSMSKSMDLARDTGQEENLKQEISSWYGTVW